MVGAYRADIQGLRAVAVLAVVVFHVAPLRLTGGYVGVDVFFVISGYLITLGIRSAWERGDFTFSGFYAKRVRRLFPALFFTIFITLALGFAFLLPHELIFLSESAVASLSYVSNMFFMLKSDYFNSVLKTNALLHTWSLSVEEQFYLLFPAALIFALRRKRRVLLAFGAAAALSFALGQALLSFNDAWAFFLAPTRFWQFLAGASLVFVRAPALPDVARDALGLGGLAAIAVSCLVLHEGTPVPGLWVAPATFGAAAVILAGMKGPGPLTRLVLCNKTAVFIGTISYSTYLMHWPIVVFYELNVSQTNIVEKAGLLAASLAAGAFCWRFVERPGMRAPLTRPWRVLAAGVGGTALCAVVAWLIVIADGVESRFTPEQVAAARVMERLQREAMATASDRAGRCFINTSRNKDVAAVDIAACMPGSGAPFRIALVGDSHAHQYVRGLEAIYGQDAIGRITASGCRPLLEGDGAAPCREYMRRAFEKWLPEGRFDMIVLAGRWRPAEADAIRETADAALGWAPKVVVIGPIVEYRQALPRILATAAPGAHADAASPLSLLGEKRALDRRLARALLGSGAVYVSVIDAMCPDGVCVQTTADGVPIQFDYGHLSLEGSVEVVRRLYDGAGFGAHRPAG